MNMNIVIPMAGIGKRFKDVGYELPKPIIKVNGYPMIWWAIKSLPSIIPEQTFFIVRDDHIKDYGIDERLRNIFSSQINIIPQSKKPEGQADTVLLVKNQINNGIPLIIYNCDTYVKGLPHLLQQATHDFPDTDGFIPTFKSNDPGLSYVKVNTAGYITEVAEKVPISIHGTIGLYHFANGKDFVYAAEKMIKDDFRVNGEFYVLPTYQYLINQGRKYRKIDLSSKEVHILGTPEDLNNFICQ